MAPKTAPAETPAIVGPARRRRNLRAVWRVLCWGGSAAAALAAVVLVSQTEIGGERLQLAFAQASEPRQPQAVAVLPPRVIVDEAETRRLADAVRALTADRDRLNARIASLKRNFDDMTGSVKAVMQANAAAQSVKEPKEPMKEKVAAPVISAPVVSTAVVSPPAAPAPATAIAPAPPPPQTAEPQLQEYVPLPPVRVASAPASEPAAEPPPPAKIEYGVDLGGAVTVEAIRGEWLAVKANFGLLLAGLRPIASPRPRHPSGTDYRLVIGPLPTAAAAARLCAKFNSARAACRTAKFTGEDLALR
jgi:hypothetical protein